MLLSQPASEMMHKYSWNQSFETNNNSHANKNKLMSTFYFRFADSSQSNLLVPMTNEEIFDVNVKVSIVYIND